MKYLENLSPKSLFYFILLSDFSLFGQQFLYLDSKQPINKRVEDLLSRMTLEEKIGQMNMPCVYEKGLGKDVQSKFDGVRKFTAGTKEPGVGPGGRIFHVTKHNTL